MGKTIKILAVLFLLFSFSDVSFAQSGSEAVTYMDELLGSVEEFKGETWAYLKSVTRGKSARKVDKKRQKLISGVKSVRKVVNKFDAYNGDESLKLALFEYLDLTFSVLKEDYDKILNMEEIAAQSYDMMEAYMKAQERASEKMTEASDKLSQAEKVFAANNNINLIEGELDKKGQKIKKASESLSYYNDIYLLQFKCYIQEVYILEALDRGDVSAVEQNNSAFKSFINEDRAILDTFPAYEDDKSLIDATLALLDFYELESSEYFTEITNYFIEKENFERVQKHFANLSEQDRTEQDVNKYNAAVGKFNSSVNAFNEIMEKSNQERHKAIKIWNHSVDSFFGVHNK